MLRMSENRDFIEGGIEIGRKGVGKEIKELKEKMGEMEEKINEVHGFMKEIREELRKGNRGY